MEQAIQKPKRVKAYGSTRGIFVNVIIFQFIFLWMHTAIGKILDLENFGNSLKRYPILIEYAGLLKWGISLIEIAVSALLVFPITRRLGLWSSLALMLAFTGFLLYINTTKEVTFCSCNGVISSLNAQQHIWFNIAFIALAILGVALTRNVAAKHLSPIK